MSQNRTAENLLIAAMAFVSGACLGLLLAPRSGRETRAQIASYARESADWAEHQGQEIADKVRTTTQDVVDRYVPSVGNLDDATDPDILGDLRDLPRK